jgi:phytoene dehydrogenase-like protein
MTSSDVIIIGGGHNGLVAAAMLAKAGRKVTLLEAAADVGGPARAEELAPGFSVSATPILNRLHSEVVRALDLEKHGLNIGTKELAPTIVLAEGSDPLVLHGAYGERLSGASESEAAAWQTLREQLLRYAGVLAPFQTRRPPDLAGMSLGETAGFARIGLSLRRLGREDMRDFLRMLLMNVTDVLDEHLTDERLRGLLAFDAVLGSHLGPRSPTSLLGLYYRLAGQVAGNVGAQVIGTETAIAAIERAAVAAGVTIRRETPVARILAANGCATGVLLETGEELHAPTVVSAISPRTTLLDLVGARNLDTGFMRKVGNIRMKGNVASLHLALDRIPAISRVADEHSGARIVIAPSADHVERAFNPAKYGEYSPEPVMELTLARQDNGCVLSANVQYAPYALKQGWETGKPKFLAAILAQLERHLPGIGQTVLHSRLLTPLDLETRYRMKGGHWHHGELQADQMLMSRPVSGWAGYGTPIDGLYLCGAGSHPGGGISGLPGLNAARRVLEAKQ